MPKIPAKILESVWVEGDVQITTTKGTHHKLRAKKYGGIIVHPAVDEKHKGWVVTSDNTGFAMTSVSTEEDALKIGQYLWDKCCLALRLKTKEEVLLKLPSWVPRWCRACYDAGKWVDV